jgi:hypothetical protein
MAAAAAANERDRNRNACQGPMRRCNTPTADKKRNDNLVPKSKFFPSIRLYEPLNPPSSGFRGELRVYCGTVVAVDDVDDGQTEREVRLDAACRGRSAPRKGGVAGGSNVPRVPLAARLVPISGSSSRCPGLRSTGEFAARTAIESKSCSPLHQTQNKTPNLLHEVPSPCPCCPWRSDGIMDFCSPTTTFQISQKVGCIC